MFCPRCGTVAASGAASCGRCGASLARPQSVAPEPPAVRAPTNRGERAQHASGVVAQSLPKAPPRPRPALPPPPSTPPAWNPPPAGPARPGPWPPPPAPWPQPAAGPWPAPEGRGSDAPPAEAPSDGPQGPGPQGPGPQRAGPPPAAWPPHPGWPPPGREPTTSYPQWGAPPPQPWAPRPRTGWSRPSGSWWDRVLGAPAAPGAYSGTTPPTYFWQALICLFLFLPTGVAAVACSLLVTRRAQTGDSAGSVRASQLTRLWCMATLVLFAVAVLVTAATGWQG